MAPRTALKTVFSELRQTVTNRRGWSGRLREPSRMAPNVSDRAMNAR